MVFAHRLLVVVQELDSVGSEQEGSEQVVFGLEDFERVAFDQVVQASGLDTLGMEVLEDMVFDQGMEVQEDKASDLDMLDMAFDQDTLDSQGTVLELELELVSSILGRHCHHHSHQGGLRPPPSLLSLQCRIE
jgi:hypothetical protein